jgi:DNA-binding transcriptional ArsR family regulator
VEDRVSRVFAALADPTRRAILDRLARGDASVGELAEPFEISQPAVSKHLRVLESAGLISRTRVATTRLSSLRAEPLREAADWVGQYKRFWNEGFDKLDALLAAETAQAAQARETPTDGEDSR